MKMTNKNKTKREIELEQKKKKDARMERYLKKIKEDGFQFIQLKISNENLRLIITSIDFAKNQCDKNFTRSDLINSIISDHYQNRLFSFPKENDEPIIVEKKTPKQ